MKSNICYNSSVSRTQVTPSGLTKVTKSHHILSLEIKRDVSPYLSVLSLLNLNSSHNNSLAC